MYKEEIVFEDGTVYRGQIKSVHESPGRSISMILRNTIRHGYGMQVWPDGAKYEGYWRDNVAEGRGMFYHVDGDIYDGNNTFYSTSINLTFLIRVLEQ